MSLLKKIQEISKAEEEFKLKHPWQAGGITAFPLLDKIIDHEIKPYIYEGKKQGYEEASNEYEKKLLKQAEEFLRQEKDFRKEREGYESLLDEYEKEIDFLNAKVNKTEAEKEYLYQLMIKERELWKLGK